MWRALLFGLARLASGQEVDDDDEAVVSDDPETKLPSAQELLKMLNSMDMSDEEKNKLREDIMNAQGQGMGAEAQKAFATSDFTSQTLVLLLLLSIITSIFVFFGYKLYKSLSDREKKREEKKKIKQLKKKK